MYAVSTAIIHSLQALNGKRASSVPGRHLYMGTVPLQNIRPSGVMVSCEATLCFCGGAKQPLISVSKVGSRQDLRDIDTRASVIQAYTLRTSGDSQPNGSLQPQHRPSP